MLLLQFAHSLLQAFHLLLELFDGTVLLLGETLYIQPGQGLEILPVYLRPGRLGNTEPAPDLDFLLHTLAGVFQALPGRLPVLLGQRVQPAHGRTIFGSIGPHRNLGILVSGVALNGDGIVLAVRRVVIRVKLFEEFLHIDIELRHLVEGNLHPFLAVRPNLEDLARPPRRDDLRLRRILPFDIDPAHRLRLDLEGLALPQMNHFKSDFTADAGSAYGTDKLLAARDLLVVKHHDDIVAFDSGLVRRTADRDITDADALSRVQPEMLRQQLRQWRRVKTHTKIRPPALGIRYGAEDQQGRTSQHNCSYFHSYLLSQILKLTTDRHRTRRA